MSISKKHDAISNERQLCVYCRFYILMDKASDVSFLPFSFKIKMNTATGMHPLSQNVVWEEGVTSVSGEIPLLLQYHLPLYISVYTLAGSMLLWSDRLESQRLFYLCGTMIIVSFDRSCDVLISAWPYLVRRSNECQATRIVVCVPLC